MRLQELNERLADLKAKQRYKANWERHLNVLEEELQSREQERRKWEERLRKEQRDVDRLSGLSFGALFYTLLGTRKEKLSVEQEELLRAKLKLEEDEDSLADVKADLEEVRRQLQEVQWLENDIRLVMEQKERLILEAYPDLAAELRTLTEREAEEEANAKELREALSSGRAVLGALDRAAERLESARNWGAYDMLGGGVIATAVKHNRIDEARNAIHSAQHALRRFQKELADVQRDVQIRIDIGGMLTFADFLFDNLFTDWIVQGRIKEAQKEVSDKRTQVYRIVSDVEKSLHRCESELAALRRKREMLIEQA